MKGKEVGRAEKRALVRWKPLPFLPATPGNGKESRMFIGEMGKGVGRSKWSGLWESLCLWSVPRKQDSAPQHLVWGRQDPGVPRQLTTEKAMGVKGGTQGCLAHRSSLPFLWIFRIRPSLCFAVARPFLGRFPVKEGESK
jgi:hypothetical protein